jgi:hypothetical protein
MEKYVFSVIAIVKGEDITLHREEMQMNITFICKKYPVLHMARMVLPFVDWQLDDGEDKEGTDYCQYVFYEDENDKSRYVLATWIGQ